MKLSFKQALALLSLFVFTFTFVFTMTVYADPGDECASCCTVYCPDQQTVMIRVIL
jgi:hypothetical protein